jgi:hypothetical protein
MNTSATTTSVLLSVSFEPAVYSGTMFCAALPSGTALTTINQIIGSNAVQFSADESGSILALVGLKEISSYDAYCYLTNVINFGNSLSQVLSTKRTFQTTCCRTGRCPKYINYVFLSIFPGPNTDF